MSFNKRESIKVFFMMAGFLLWLCAVFGGSFGILYVVSIFVEDIVKQVLIGMLIASLYLVLIVSLTVGFISDDDEVQK